MPPTAPTPTPPPRPSRSAPPSRSTAPPNPPCRLAVARSTATRKKGTARPSLSPLSASRACRTRASRRVLDHPLAQGRVGREAEHRVDERARQRHRGEQQERRAQTQDHRQRQPDQENADRATPGCAAATAGRSRAESVKKSRPAPARRRARPALSTRTSSQPRPPAPDQADRDEGHRRGDPRRSSTGDRAVRSEHQPIVSSAVTRPPPPPASADASRATLAAARGRRWVLAELGGRSAGG